MALVSAAFPWDQVWAALGTRTLTTSQRSNWYKVVTNITRTQYRLHRINRSPDPYCVRCGAVDTVVHRLSQCTWQARQAWAVCADKVAYLLGVPVTSDLIVRPAMGNAPKDKRAEAAMLVACHVETFYEDE